MEIQGRELIVDEKGVVVHEPQSYDSNDLTHLQLMIVSTSMNHEYSRMAYQRARTFEDKQKLLARMDRLKELYFTARNRLSFSHPERIERIERELAFQKQMVLSEGRLQ